MNRSIGALGGILVLLFALLIAGCGDSGDQEQLSKAAFVKQGNEICADATEAREQIVNEFAETTDPNENLEAARRELMTKIMPTYEGAAEQIDELGAPAGDEAKIDEIVAAMKEAVERTEADPKTAMVGNLPFRKANAAAESYGLKACTI